VATYGCGLRVCMQELFLGAAPYNLSVSTVSYYATIPVGACGLMAATVAGVLHKVIGANAQQGVGFVLGAVGILGIGPSHLFDSFLPQSLGQVAGFMALYGSGMAIALLMQPVLMLRILQRDGGLKKNEVLARAHTQRGDRMSQRTRPRVLSSWGSLSLWLSPWPAVCTACACMAHTPSS
jgi:hypothetical protein